MANSKISALTAATTPLAGTEVLPIVQSGVTKQVSVANLTAGRAVSMASGTITGDLTVDTNTLYANSTAHEVCVGTTTSINAGKFNVKGDSAHNTICATPYANGYYNYYGTNTSGTGTFYVRGDGISYFAGEMTVAAQLNNTGDHVITNGNVVPSTAAKGINFTANTGAAGMTSQLLNWYEEGNWTPTQGAGLTVVGTFSSDGQYTRIGRLVTVKGRLIGSTSVAAAAASIMCGGLPYSSNGQPFVGSVMNNPGLNASGTVATSGTNLYSTAMAASATLVFTVTYFV